MSTVEQSSSVVIDCFKDPIETISLFWPQYTLYDKQQEILYSLRDNYETIVPAAHELGKDFTAALGVLWFFLSRRPCRILTTSPNSSQLEDVLWGEIRRFIRESQYPLPFEVMGDMKIYQTYDNGERIPLSECIGAVYKTPDSMMGRHIPRTPYGEPTTLVLADEASGCEHEGWDRTDSWAHRKLVIGNPYPCNNFFFLGATMGNEESLRAYAGYEKLLRKVIKIKAEDSPNVRLALQQIARGQEPTNEIITPGVCTYADYQQRRKSWDAVQQAIRLDAEFYRGAEFFMYPSDWIQKAHEYHQKTTLKGIKRRARAIGVDPAEGGDMTTWCVVDEYGIIELCSLPTKNTTLVMRRTFALMRKHRLFDCDRIFFDRGGGGKQHADYMRNHIIDNSDLKSEFSGEFQSIGFGESVSPRLSTGRKSTKTRTHEKEDTYEYKNRRAQMYGMIRKRIDPDNDNYKGFGIPKADKYTKDTIARKSLVSQLSIIPLRYDSEGRMVLLPKSKKPNSKETTLIDLIGHSPDEADALALAVYGLEQPKRRTIGAL